MKVIIEIPDDYYKACQMWHKQNVATVEQIVIAKGTPYPTGEWIKCECEYLDVYKCSCCGRIINVCKEDFNDGDFAYCDSCGAKMSN